MDSSENKQLSETEYKQKKREELKVFFKDLSVSQDVLDRIIENELCPVTEDKPYIAAHSSSEVKSEYEVMTGQPFTTVDDYSKPLTTEEIKDKIKGSSVIAEKARQIQILGQTEAKSRYVPIDKLCVPSYSELSKEIEAADGDERKIEEIKYRHMKALVKSADEFDNQNQINVCEKPVENTANLDGGSITDDEEFEAIDKIVTQLTNKPYEVRYQETLRKIQGIKDIQPDETTSNLLDIEGTELIEENSSGSVNDGASTSKEVKSCQNETVNLNVRKSSLTPSLEAIQEEIIASSNNNVKNVDTDKSVPKNFEFKLKRTESVLRDIDNILSSFTRDGKKDSKDEPTAMAGTEDLDITNTLSDSKKNNDVDADDKLKQTYEDDQKLVIKDNYCEVEIKEMENFINNIVDNAENLSLLINEDVTNKLNSMNELLGEVNEALEESRKSNIRYEHLIKGKSKNVSTRQSIDEQDALANEKDDSKSTGNIPKSSVSQTDIDDIFKSINSLKDEIKHHENRVDRCAETYDIRNKQCQDVIAEIDNVLNKSKNILHPTHTDEIEVDNKDVNSGADLQAQGDYKRSNTNIIEMGDATETKGVSSLEEYSINANESEKRTKEEEKKKQIMYYKEKMEKENEEKNRGPQMTKQFIKNHCKQNKLYSTPYLNDILYLHFKGFSKIENLEEYTGLKCIFLENNGIQKIEGLDTLAELKCLYLHYNMIRKIENLQGCPKLNTLNLDHNFVTKIENLDVVPDLQTLNIAHNMVATADDLEHLRFCHNLSVLDLSYNRLEDPLIVDVLADMLTLKVLVLTGNPVVRNIPSYRKTLTLRLKELLNLDNRPVFPRDRACAEAWQRGGIQEEMAERKRWIAKEHEKTMQSVRCLIKMRDKNKARREMRENEEKEKLGQTTKDDANEENDSEERFGAKIETEGDVAVDMLSGSEAEDSSSSEDEDEDDDLHRNKDIDIKGNIEWSALDAGKRLVQEINDDIGQEEWCGFHQMPSKENNSSDILAVNDLLFNKANEPEKNTTNRIMISEIVEDDKISRENKMETNIKEKAINVDHKKPLIEIIDCVKESAGFYNDDKKKEIRCDTIQKDTNVVSSDAKQMGIQEENKTQKAGENLSFVEYMRQMNSDDPQEVEPNEEDLVILKELEEEQKEREARIAMGKPAIDPMKLYHKETMEAFYQREDMVSAHQVTEPSHVTEYRTNNAFDRIALSQRSSENLDETKVKLTRVPGATLVQYVDSHEQNNTLALPQLNDETSVSEEMLSSDGQNDEQAIYDDLTVIAKHTSRIENQKNTIIEHFTDNLDNVSLEQVSTVLESHLVGTSRGKSELSYTYYAPSSDEEDMETTLTANGSFNLDDTLTETFVEADDSGIFNISLENNETGNEKCDEHNAHNDENVKVNVLDVVNMGEETINASKITDTSKERDEDPSKVTTENDKDAKNIPRDTKSVDEDNLGDKDEQKDELFEDCVEVPIVESKNENYTLEMKLALRITDKD
ncbi:dynein axonemal assembly factor 1 homolog isoform X2 [Aricia agestis]|uniref:dynein axonemal assembly factor 1 homolog isoform X2 n=1 Tax=Aricia agestis TaxID=91739 RepID=UPI001C20256D|nr:dynein axonemal assembly factor 1 homolog isoform X2 [Aricia agestis]